MTVSLRVATPDDGAACAAIYAPYVTGTAISFESEPPSTADMAARIARTLPVHPWLVAEEGGAVIGYAYAGRHAERAAYRWAAEVSVYVMRGRHRRGVGRTLYRALLNVLKAQGFETAWGGATLPNPASVGLHESFGFRHVGSYRRVGFKSGGWHDVGWWGLDLGGASCRAGDPPPDPVPFAEYRTRPGWVAALSTASP
jgi:phosphinothricin acetyltransferase